MKKMDEMDRNLQLHSEEWGYRAALLSLSAWTLFSCWQALMHDGEYKPFTVSDFVLCSLCSGIFSNGHEAKNGCRR